GGALKNWNIWPVSVPPAVCGTGIGSPAEVLTPKLPFQVPKTLMNRRPNQPLSVKRSLIMFTRLTLAAALPVVAFPPAVLLVVLASPDLACTLMLLLMVWLLVLFRVSLLLMLSLAVTPPPSSAAVVPAGAFRIMPYHLPVTFTKTSRSLVASTSVPVR